MDINREVDKFKEKHPSYANQIVSFELVNTNGIKFKLIDGKEALYFPWEIEEEKPKKKKKKVKNGISNR